MVVYPFCRFFAHRRRDLFFSGLKNRNPLTIAQKGFLHDKERMISSVLINEKMTDRTLMNAVGRLTFISLYSLFPIEADWFYFFAF